MKSPRSASRPDRPNSVLWRLLTLEQLMTGSLVHLVYWFGLGVIALGGFGAIGASVGVALREGPLMGLLAAIPVAVAGILVICAMAIVWRSFCEFYVVIIGIGEDLHALRRKAEGDSALAAIVADATASAAPASAKRRRTAADGDQ
jgi:hypothetical protein